jgi:glucosamine kinase
MAGTRVIGEVGGSSSRWAVVNDAGARIALPVQGRPVLGFNPLNGDRALFTSDLRDAMAAHAPDMVHAEHVVVYGAGCGAPGRRSAMAEVLNDLWPAASVEVETDLVGAARGMVGRESGLVLILGTGMNAGYHDGMHTHTPMPSLGWVLGDEGSGADIGRMMLQDAIHRRMPDDLRGMIFDDAGPHVDHVLEQVYRSPFPARALAAYTARLAQCLHEPYVRDLLRGRFHLFIDLLEQYFSHEQRRNVYATGSVAYGFREVLGECLLDRGMTLMAAEPDPLPGLLRYHDRS